MPESVTNSSSQVLAWLPFPTPSSTTYSSAGSAPRASRSSQILNSSRMSSRTAPESRAALSPPGSARSYSRPVACSQKDSACQYSVLKRQMQLAEPGPHGSSGSCAELAGAACSASSLVTSAPRSGPARRRSTASSNAVSAAGSPSSGSQAGSP